MLDFSAAPEESGDLIPDGQIMWVYIKVREVKFSRQGTKYLDLELTVAENQPYAKRKIWTNLMDPSYQQNSEGARNMGYLSVRRILEGSGKARPDNPGGYQISSLEEINQLKVPVWIKIRKSKDPNYDDQNDVEFLSPYSASKKIVKAHQALVEGQTNISQKSDNAIKSQMPVNQSGNMNPAGFPQQQQQSQQQWQPPSNVDEIPFD